MYHLGVFLAVAASAQGSALPESHSGLTQVVRLSTDPWNVNFLTCDPVVSPCTLEFIHHSPDHTLPLMTESPLCWPLTEHEFSASPCLGCDFIPHINRISGSYLHRITHPGFLYLHLFKQVYVEHTLGLGLWMSSGRQQSWSDSRDAVLPCGTFCTSHVSIELIMWRCNQNTELSILIN